MNNRQWERSRERLIGVWINVHIPTSFKSDGTVDKYETKKVYVPIKEPNKCRMNGNLRSRGCLQRN